MTRLVPTTVPAGNVLLVEQVVGTCGESSILTDMFKVSLFDKTGKLIKSY